jgi:hypothetical protein
MRGALLLPGLLLAATAACDDDGTGPEEQSVVGQLTVSTNDSAFVALGDSATLASASTPWDIKFWTTGVFLRTSGTPVVALCLCQNAASTNEQIVAMTADSEKGDFDLVTAAQIPPATDSRWANTTFDTSRWYRYNIAPATQPNYIHPTFDVYLVKKGSAVYKLQILSYYNAAAQSRNVTFRYQRLVG